MLDSIIITVNLVGEIEGCVRHTTRQKHTVLLSEDFGGSMSRIIKHSDRKELPSVRMFSVPGDVVNSWVKGDCPYWENSRDWKKMNLIQRVISNVNRFDDGCGVSFEFIGDGEVE